MNTIKKVRIATGIKAFKNTDFSVSSAEPLSGEGSPLDADVIEWLQSAGRGYQTRMNAILRDAMVRSVS